MRCIELFCQSVFAGTEAVPILNEVNSSYEKCYGSTVVFAF